MQKLYSIEELKSILQCGESKTRQIVRNKIGYIKVGQEIRVTQDMLDKYFTRNTVAPLPEVTIKLPKSVLKAAEARRQSTTRIIP